MPDHTDDSPATAAWRGLHLNGPELRPAKALIGWLPDQRAYQMLSSGRADDGPTAEHEAALGAARARVAARPEGIDQDGVVSPTPAGLAEYEATLRMRAAHLYDEGWELRLVDLPRLCALQPAVFTENAEERAGGLVPDDLPGIAGLTVPVASETQPQVAFGQSRNAWVMVSPSPNLHVVDQFSGEIKGAPPGTHGFGFIVGVLPSHLQVVEFEERFFLRDGYHRSLGLLSRGVTVVPAFVRTIGDIGEIAHERLLPVAAVTGPRPPLLSDYLSDDVAADVQLPASQQVVIVQGLEMPAFSQT